MCYPGKMENTCERNNVNEKQLTEDGTLNNSIFLKHPKKQN